MERLDGRKWCKQSKSTRAITHWLERTTAKTRRLLRKADRRLYLRAAWLLVRRDTCCPYRLSTDHQRTSVSSVCGSWDSRPRRRLQCASSMCDAAASHPHSQMLTTVQQQAHICSDVCQMLVTRQTNHVGQIVWPSNLATWQVKPMKIQN